MKALFSVLAATLVAQSAHAESFFGRSERFPRYETTQAVVPRHHAAAVNELRFAAQSGTAIPASLAIRTIDVKLCNDAVLSFDTSASWRSGKYFTLTLPERLCVNSVEFTGRSNGMDNQRGGCWIEIWAANSRN